MLTRFSLCFLTILSLCGCTVASLAKVPEEDLEKSLAWWREARFGMFIHWGPVSLKGTEIGWSRDVEVPVKEYDDLPKQFNPLNFDAKEWIGIAKDAGMKYFVITTKHHGGFCLWDSKVTDHDIMSTPFGRDLIKELAEECKKQDVRFCTYYSIMDWYHPDYNFDNAHGGPGYSLPEVQAPDLDRYVDFMNAQLRELVENYGPLGILWFDGEWMPPWTYERGQKLFHYVKSLQPGILINNRTDMGRAGMEGVTKSDRVYLGDFDTPEQRTGLYQTDHPWESCITLGDQWAWKPNDNLKSLKTCIHLLVQSAGGDGNFLLNIGPMPDGRIEPRQVERLC